MPLVCAHCWGNLPLVTALMIPSSPYFPDLLILIIPHRTYVRRHSPEHKLLQCFFFWWFSTTSLLVFHFVGISWRLLPLVISMIFIQSLFLLPGCFVSNARYAFLQVYTSNTAIFDMMPHALKNGTLFSIVVSFKISFNFTLNRDFHFGLFDQDNLLKQFLILWFLCVPVMTILTEISNPTLQWLFQYCCVPSSSVSCRYLYTSSSHHSSSCLRMLSLFTTFLILFHTPIPRQCFSHNLIRIISSHDHQHAFTFSWCLTSLNTIWLSLSERQVKRMFMRANDWAATPTSRHTNIISQLPSSSDVHTFGLSFLSKASSFVSSQNLRLSVCEVSCYTCDLITVMNKSFRFLVRTCTFIFFALSSCAGSERTAQCHSLSWPANAG